MWQSQKVPIYFDLKDTKLKTVHMKVTTKTVLLGFLVWISIYKVFLYKTYATKALGRKWKASIFSIYSYVVNCSDITINGVTSTIYKIVLFLKWHLKISSWERTLQNIWQLRNWTSTVTLKGHLFLILLWKAQLNKPLGCYTRQKHCMSVLSSRFLTPNSTKLVFISGSSGLQESIVCSVAFVKTQTLVLLNKTVPSNTAHGLYWCMDSKLILELSSEMDAYI